MADKLWKSMTPGVNRRRRRRSRSPSARACSGRRSPAWPRKTRVSDREIVEAIQAVLAATPFHGEGYRKVRARLAHRGSPSAASPRCG
jgi:putative transposase